nr:DUF6064 family protein [uncultured Oscillibacter sp.]
MDAQVFWDVIGNYNRQTWIIQIALLIFLLIAVALSYTKKIKWAAKFSLGIINLFIGIGFFAWYGTEPILFMLCPFTNRRKTGGKAEAFFEKSEKIFRGFFKRRKPQKGGLGVATPTRFPQDKMSD